MKQNTIAIICDCDHTLASDTTQFLLDQNKIPKAKFWKEVSKLVTQGWDPPLAWMEKILNLMNDGYIKQNSNEKLTVLGKKIKSYKGVPTMVKQLNSKIQKVSDFKKAGVNLEFYIISQGIEVLIANCKDFSEFQVFASNYSENKKTKIIDSIKSVVTFTEKTKFLFAIHKGITATELRKIPYLVNNEVPTNEKRIPFEHMIYLGDSPNDIPCFSMVEKLGGCSIGITPGKSFKKGYELAKRKRTTMGPYSPDYSKGSQLRKALESAILSIADDIVLKERLAKRI